MSSPKMPPRPRMWRPHSQATPSRWCAKRRADSLADSTNLRRTDLRVRRRPCSFAWTEWHAPCARGRIGELQPLGLRRALCSRLVVTDRDERAGARRGVSRSGLRGARRGPRRRPRRVVIAAAVLAGVVVAAAVVARALAGGRRRRRDRQRSIRNRRRRRRRRCRRHRARHGRCERHASERVSQRISVVCDRRSRRRRLLNIIWGQQLRGCCLERPLLAQPAALHGLCLPRLLLQRRRGHGRGRSGRRTRRRRQREAAQQAAKQRGARGRCEAARPVHARRRERGCRRGRRGALRKHRRSLICCRRGYRARANRLRLSSNRRHRWSSRRGDLGLPRGCRGQSSLRLTLLAEASTRRRSLARLAVRRLRVAGRPLVVVVSHRRRVLLIRVCGATVERSQLACATLQITHRCAAQRPPARDTALTRPRVAPAAPAQAASGARMRSARG